MRRTPFALLAVPLVALAGSLPAFGQAGSADPATAPDPASATAPATAPGAPAAPGSASAAAQPPSGAQPSASATPIAIPASGELPLSLQDAIVLAIQNNLDVEIERYQPEIADQDLLAAWGAYDPRLVSDFAYSSDKTPVASPFQSSASITSRTTGGEAGIIGLIPKLGWTYDVNYFGQKNDTDSSIQSLSPQYTANLRASAVLPIMKGFLWGQPWVQVKTTRLGTQVAYDQFRTTLMDSVRDVELGYWSLSARAEELAVAHKSLETSRALLDQTEAQYQVGVVSKVEVVQAEAGVADRDFRLITVENLYRRAQDSLINLTLGTNLGPNTALTIEPTDRSDDYVVFSINAEEAAAKAFNLRPELAVARSRVSQQELQVQFAKNQRLPQVDVTARYGYQGLAGDDNPNRLNFTGLPLPSLGARNSYWDTSDYFFHNDNKQWSAGVVVSVPIPNTTGRANVEKSELELRRSLTEVRRLEQSIVLEVRNAARNLQSALQGIEAAERAVTASAEQLRAEQIRLEHGESTPFDVLLRENDLVQAESQRIAAFEVYHRSVAELDRAQGTILRDRNVVVDQALPLR